MTRRFSIDSDMLHSDLTVEISIQCREADGADADYVIERISNQHGNEVGLSALPIADVRRIKKHALEIAEECGPYAYQEYVEGLAERAWEFSEDR